jgi:hypothetical protein
MREETINRPKSAGKSPLNRLKFSLNLGVLCYIAAHNMAHIATEFKISKVRHFGQLFLSDDEFSEGSLQKWNSVRRNGVLF